MSELPQETKPDLHAIRGLDDDGAHGEDSEASVEPVVIQRPDDAHHERDREGLDEVAQSAGSAPAGDQGENGQLGQGGDDQIAPGGDGAWSGITRPSRRGSPRRFLTDVIVEMGLVSQKQVEEAIETSRSSGTTPERVLLDAGTLTHDALSRALAERHG